MLKDVVWQGAEPVLMVRNRHFLGPALLSHSLEQVVSARWFGPWIRKGGTEMSGEGHTESKALTPQRRSAPLTFAVVVYVTDGRGGTKCDHAEGYA
jgi:hypothetical protein